MWNLLTCIIWILVIILGMIIFIPYEYRAFGKKDESGFIWAKAVWLFGGAKFGIEKHFPGNMLLRVTIFGIHKNIDFSKSKEKVKKQKKTTKEKRLKSNKPQKEKTDFMEFVKKEVLVEGLRFVLRILKHMGPRQFYIRGKVGFEDPATTGMMCAVLGMNHSYLQKYNIRIQPMFEKEGIKGKFFIGGKIWIPYLILVSMGFLFTKAIRNIWITKLKTKIKGRKLSWQSI